MGGDKGGSILVIEASLRDPECGGFGVDCCFLVSQRTLGNATTPLVQFRTGVHCIQGLSSSLLNDSYLAGFNYFSHFALS